MYLCTSEKDGVYDNTPGQRRPGGKKGDGMEEDIYGGVGGVDEGVYDTAGGVKKGMKYSEEGLYDNPLAGKGELSRDPVVDNVREYICSHASCHISVCVYICTYTSRNPLFRTKWCLRQHSWSEKTRW